MTISRFRIRLWLELLFVILVPCIFLGVGIRKFGSGSGSFGTIVIVLLCLRALVLLRFIKLMVKWFHSSYIIQKRAAKKTNRALLGTSVLVVFLLLETVFMFIPQTQDVYRLGLANKLWNIYYKAPLNEMGFRDKPLAGRLENKKERIFFLGDSYTYGNGLKHNRDRFTDKVYAQMDSTKFEAFNLGRGNTDTHDEYFRLVDIGIRPDYLILQYYHNDIEKTGARHGHFNISQTGYKNQKPSLLKKSASFLALLPLQSSFLLNYTALNSSVFLIPKGSKDYKDCLTKAYSDTACLNEHLQDLKNIIEYAAANRIKLYVLFVPDARDIDYTQSLFNSYIIPFLRQKQVRYITLDKPFKTYKTSQLVINPLNAHANSFANSIIAEQILDSISELKR